MKLRGSLGVVIAGLAFTTTATGVPLDRHFGDGTYRVGTGSGSVRPGTYRARGGSGCYWERLRNFSGGVNSILANDNAIGPVVVTILRSDRGFSSHDCGGWTSNLSRITKSMTRFGNG